MILRVAAAQAEAVAGDLTVNVRTAAATFSRPACLSSTRAVAAALAWVLLVTSLTMLMYVWNASATFDAFLPPHGGYRSGS